MKRIYPIIDYESEYGTILCPGCKAVMQPIHWHYSNKDPLFTNMYLCLNCGEYVFDKEKGECMTFPKNILVPSKESQVTETVTNDSESMVNTKLSGENRTSERSQTLNIFKEERTPKVPPPLPSHPTPTDDSLPRTKKIPNPDVNAVLWKKKP